MRISIILGLVLAAAVPAAAQQDGFADNRGLEMQFTTVVGSVTDEQGNVMEGVKVEIREASVDASAVPNTADFGAWGVEAVPSETTSDPTRDSEIFAWGETNAKGRYEITGVRRPGAYILIIRNQEAYRRVDAPISVAGSVGSSFKANLVMRPLVGAAPPTSVSVQGLVALAQEAENSGDLDTAMAKIEEVATLAPDSPIPRFHLARLAAANGDPERALEEIKTSTELDPQCGDCWLLQANIERDQGQADAALECATKAVELIPESDDAQGVRGLLLYEAQRYDEALPCLEKSVELGSTDANVHLFRANCYVAARRFRDADAAYREFLEKFPDAPNRAQIEQMLVQLSGMS
jgi:Flp pilus assembly protein TadD